jgi:glutamate-1-semialdehyde 2,1-aminomutase
LAYGPVILGHSPDELNEAVKRQIDLGTQFGNPGLSDVIAAERIIDLVPCAESVRFNNTGTEAVQSVVRLARAYTGRNKIIKFEGHYHGWLDNIYISHLPECVSMLGMRNNPWPALGSAGQSPSSVGDLVILPWNDLAIVEQALCDHRGEIAAILTEPIMSNCAVIPPKEGYLEGLRKLADQYDVLLIFDEVITGFRVAPGGAQEYLGVTPDVSTFAKAIGGGYPVAGICGRKDVFKHIASYDVVHAGTYNGNALVMAAVNGVLDAITKNDFAFYKHVTRLGKNLMAGIEEAAKENNIKLRVHGPGPMFGIAFTDMDFYDFRSYAKVKNSAWVRFRRRMLENGVHIFPTDKGLFYLSAAHTDEDIAYTIKVIRKVFAEFNYND